MRDDPEFFKRDYSTFPWWENAPPEQHTDYTYIVQRKQSKTVTDVYENGVRIERKS